MAKVIHCISGLGADRRIFANTRIPGFVLHHIEWIPPAAHESLQEYAARLTDGLRTRQSFFLGVSFGGMLAVEVAKLQPKAKVAIVSSIKTRQELWPLYRAAAYTGLQHLIPFLLPAFPSFLASILFGTSGGAERKLLRQMICSTDPLFASWAIEQILQWSNQTIPPNVFHVHGTRDWLLPQRFARPHEWVDQAGHFMIYNRASEVNSILSKWAFQVARHVV